MEETQTNTDPVEETSKMQSKFIVKKLLKRGFDFEHSVNCQDAVRVVEVNNFLYCAVFDGCSGGEESHFASSLFSKVFREVINNVATHLDTNDSNLEANVSFIIHMMARKILQAKNFLELTTNELLSTMVMCAIDKNSNDCIVCAFGDGFYSVDGQDNTILNTRFINMDSGDNRPDYMAYDLNLIQSASEFLEWFSKKTEIHHFKNVINISIASDGINTFKKTEFSTLDVDPIQFLIKDEKWIDNAIMLERKYNILINNKITNSDDVSIVRVKIV